MRSLGLVALAFGLLQGACAPALQSARMRADDIPSERELEAARSEKAQRCSPRWGALYPGLGQLCDGRDAEAAALLGLGTAELATGLSVGLKTSFSNPGAALPLLAFGDLLAASALDNTLRAQRARRIPYTPPETLSELALAPFNPAVLAQPDVWGGILGTVAVGLAFEQLVDSGLSTDSFKKRPRLFGRDVNSAVGYPLGLGIGVGLFEHVAIAEEMAFRGLLQSGWARRYDERTGWVLGSLVFGAFHASNALFLDPDQRLSYLAKAVPFITLVGSYLGFTYQRHGYTLSTSVAVHFWYDFLLEATAFILDPKGSPLAMAFAW